MDVRGERRSLKSNMWEKEHLTKIYRVEDDWSIDRNVVYRMDKNEKTWPFPDIFIDAIKAKISSDILTNYPNLGAVYSKMSRYLEVDVRNIFFHMGSDLVIKSIYESYIDKGDKIIMPYPVYAMSKIYGDIYQADINYSEYLPNYTLDVESLICQISKIKPKLVVVENPNGNLGTYIDRDEIVSILETANQVGTIVLLDEAYVDFTNVKTNDLIDKYDNLLIVRTLSKAWGMAGLRIGYVISNADNIEYIKKLRPMHELTSFSAIVVETLLDNIDILNDFLNDIEESKAYFYEQLDRRGIEYIESGTHFVSMKFDSSVDIAMLCSKFKKYKYYVKGPIGIGDYSSMIRVGVLPVDEMKEFIRVIDEVMKR